MGRTVEHKKEDVRGQLQNFKGCECKEMADSPLQSIEACEGGRRVTQNGNEIITSGEMAQPPEYK